MTNIFVGNDIVDLTEPAAINKAEDTRFVQRVFSREEQKLIKSSDTPSRMLWYLWAAKEAAYKICKKIDPAIAFAHQQFCISLPDNASLQSSLLHQQAFGIVRYQPYMIPVSWKISCDAVHCIGYWIDHKGEGESLPYQLIYSIAHITPLKPHGHEGHDYESGHHTTLPSHESAFTRDLARRVIKKHFGIDVDIIRPETSALPGPPKAFSPSGQINHLDLSLSHDGKMAAVAIGCNRS